MQNSRNSLLINGSLYIGGLLSLNFIISALNIPLGGLVSLAITVFTLFMLYRAAKVYRDACDGAIAYGKAFGFLFTVYFLGSIISAAIAFVYIRINTDYLPVQLNNVMQVYEQLNITVPDDMYKLMESIFTPFSFVFLQLIGSLFGAAFWSAILAAFVKKDKPVF